MLSIDPVAIYTAALRHLAAAKERLRQDPSSVVALEERQRLQQEVHDAWQRIPEEQRRVLRPPEYYD